MAINIKDKDLIERLVFVEGESWVRDMVEGATAETMFSLPWAIAQFDRRARSNPVIYGLGGWNRYFVQPDGEVMFSSRHGHTGVELAEAAGFGIHR